jgi:hypothetical protein
MQALRSKITDVEENKNQRKFLELIKEQDLVRAHQKQQQVLFKDR